MNGSVLVSGWLLAAIAASGVLVAGLWIAWELRTRGRRMRRRWIVRSVASILLLTVAAAGIADELNRYFSYVPDFKALKGNISPDLVAAPRPGQPALAQGEVRTVRIPGPASGVAARSALVYLPPGYDASRDRYPVVYLIHGSPGTAQDWIRGAYADRAEDMLLRRGRVQPMIIVTPDVNGGFTRNSQCIDRPNGERDETYVARDVVAWTDTNLRTIPAREARAIGGLSTGAFCATNVALRHQDVFSVVLSHSGTFAPSRSRLTGDLFAGDARAAEANTPARYIATIPIVRPLWFYADVGTADTGTMLENRVFVAALRARGIDVEYHEWPAERHTWDAWRRNVVVSLAFAADHLARESGPPAARVA